MVVAAPDAERRHAALGPGSKQHGQQVRAVPVESGREPPGAREVAHAAGRSRMLPQPVPQVRTVVAHQPALGEPAELPADRVQPLAFLLEAGQRVLARMTDRDHDARAHQGGLRHREAPGEHRPPVVADEVHRSLHVQRAQQPGEIAEQAIDRKMPAADRGVRFAEATQVRRDDLESGRRDARRHGLPEPQRVRKAMQQQRRRPGTDPRDVDRQIVDPHAAGALPEHPGV